MICFSWKIASLGEGRGVLPGGGDLHMKRVGMFVVSLRGVN